MGLRGVGPYAFHYVKGTPLDKDAGDLWSSLDAFFINGVDNNNDNDAAELSAGALLD